MLQFIQIGVMEMLLLQNVSKTYKNGVKALHDVNLTIDQGEFVYIIGATGSGKSSLIMLIDGEEIPTARLFGCQHSRRKRSFPYCFV